MASLPRLLCVYVITCLYINLQGLSAMEIGGGFSRKCGFPALYNFGDSNSDTGGLSASLNEVTSPNGETFFGHPSGRFCDGRLIIDFIAEALNLPYLSAYLDSVGTNFRHGANFATGGSSIRPGGYSPFDLGIQVSQFKQFKARTTALYSKLSGTEKKGNLPRPQDFSKALYTIDIGQNDLFYGFQHSTLEQVRASIPDILDKLSLALQGLYAEGARAFWVHNTGPVGCLPYAIIYEPLKPGNFDPIGCVKPQNLVAQEFNRNLKDLILKLRGKLTHATFVYVDVYSAKYGLISNAKSEGFVDPSKFCCGSYYGYHIDCGKKAVVNGTVYGNPCGQPSKHISWDGIHYSEAANQWVAKRILGGPLSDPGVSVDEACLAGNYA